MCDATPEEPEVAQLHDEHTLSIIQAACSEPPMTLTCPACSETITAFAPQFKELNSHLQSTHCLSITSLSSVSLLPEYLAYWRQTIEARGIDTLQRILPKFMLDNQEFWTLDPQLPEDQKLRHDLHLKHLNELIQVQRLENSKVAEQTCLHCNATMTGTVKELCDHMFENHGFTVGLPDNLVHLPRLLEVLQIRLSYLQCFYCEHIFRSSKMLKEHMRKKKHWRINQRNTLYDRFYLSAHASGEDQDDGESVDEEKSAGDAEDWQEWAADDEDEAETTRCIFCPSALSNPQQCFAHMKDSHKFDFFDIKQQSIALVNYARKCALSNRCMACDKTMDSLELIVQHMADENHFRPPPAAAFLSDPSFMIPVIPGDLLLTGVDDDVDVEAGT